MPADIQNEDTMGAVFTFSVDDGHPLDMKVADLLGKHGLGGTFYVPIRNSEGRPTLTGSQLRTIGRQFEVGSHTVDHRYLCRIGTAEAKRQITEGKAQLEDILGQAVSGFCYPGGQYGQSHLRQVREAGFAYARTTTNLCFDLGNSPFELPTTIQFYPHARAVYWRNFASAGSWGRRHAGLRLAVAHAGWIARIYALFDYAFATGGTFHLWTHSYEIDQFHGWKTLDRFFRHVTEHVPRANLLTNHQAVSKRFLPSIPRRSVAAPPH
jgi:peptidoglycan/xylan/chitin deacetylase (PgdA/CDA1 family)